MSPQRIQLRRTKGWLLPLGTITVARPTRWGNPFVVERNPATAGGWICHNWDASWMDYLYVHGTREACIRRAVDEHARALRGGLLKVSVDDARLALRGHDLACWCRADQPCHGDTLLEVANGPSAG